MAVFPDGLAATVLETAIGLTPITVTFKVASGATSTDPDSGNVIQPTQDVEIDCILRPNFNSRDRLFPGADQDEIVFDGRVVDSDTSYQFPDSIRKFSLLQGTCTWANRVGRLQVSIPGDAIAKNAGERFYALFTPL